MTQQPTDAEVAEIEKHEDGPDCEFTGTPREATIRALHVIYANHAALLRFLKSRQPKVLTEEDGWRMPPPHFKADPRWQRQPQSEDEWDAHKDVDRQFNAKRRLAFAGDLADPRAPECMAIVSRLDISVVLGRLAWLEARFENTRETALTSIAPPVLTEDERAVLETAERWSTNDMADSALIAQLKAIPDRLTTGTGEG